MLFQKTRLVWLIFVPILSVPSAARADDIKTVPLPSRDVVYDPGTKKIYASVPGSGGIRANSVTSIDPLTGTVGQSIFIRSEPAEMALSGQGKSHLWGLDCAGLDRP